MPDNASAQEVHIQWFVFDIISCMQAWLATYLELKVEGVNL